MADVSSIQSRRTAGTAPPTTSATPVVTIRQILKQAQADLTDKEVQTSYTYTYIWMANQVGHFALGLILVLFITWLAHLSLLLIGRWIPGAETFICYANTFIPYLVPTLVFLGCVTLEVSDVLSATKRPPGALFPIDLSDLLKDAGTALYFLLSGIVFGIVSFDAANAPGRAVLVFVILVVIAAFFAWYWLRRKLCFQRAELPFVARLADFTSSFRPTPPRVGAAAITQFLQAAACPEPATQPKHILIFGPPNSGRTTLAVAIGTEHAFDIHKCRYVTWTKFLELENSNIVEDRRRVWPWYSADILIFDDVVAPGSGMDHVSPTICSLSIGTKRGLRGRRVVWVFGVLDGADPAGWRNMMSGHLEMDESQFDVVELTGWDITTRPRVPLASRSGH